jgi:predicted kinase
MRPARPHLIVFSGLPGVGKTTVARALAARLGAVHLRIDTIEQAMRAAGAERIGPAGYAVANALAEANLRLGHVVIADCVNPVRESRLAWAAVAARASAPLLDIHLVCSDATEHRRRVESRSADIDGHVLPSWNDVERHGFEPRDDQPLVLDTCGRSPEELVELCAANLVRP